MAFSTPTQSPVSECSALTVVPTSNLASKSGFLEIT